MDNTIWTYLLIALIAFTILYKTAESFNQFEGAIPGVNRRPFAIVPGVNTRPKTISQIAISERGPTMDINKKKEIK